MHSPPHHMMPDQSVLEHRMFPLLGDLVPLHNRARCAAPPTELMPPCWSRCASPSVIPAARIMTGGRIRALMGSRGKVPIVALTAQAFTEQMDECRQAGMNGHLTKPYTPDSADRCRRARGSGTGHAQRSQPRAVRGPATGYGGQQRGRWPCIFANPGRRLRTADFRSESVRS